MVLDSKQTTVAYRCPHCGAGVISIVGMFSLSANMFRLKCPCGKSEMTVVRTDDDKLRITVPCIVCPKPHSYLLSPKLFFGKELFALNCQYSDLNICFIGEENHVKAELARTELELLDLLEKNGIESFEALHAQNEQTLTDPQIYDIIMFVINELDEDKAIRCSCNRNDDAGEDREYEVEVLDSCIRVSCSVCGDYVDIPTDTLIGAYDFLGATSLELYPNGECPQ